MSDMIFRYLREYGLETQLETGGSGLDAAVCNAK